jgi:uncharacterized membrane protein YidH (DUF202 family)
MDNRGKARGNRNIILVVLGIILVIVGIAIINIHGNPLRGSGLGTISIVVGVVLLILAVVRFSRNRKQ